MTDFFQILPLQPSGYYMYHQMKTQQFHVLPTQCILYPTAFKLFLVLPVRSFSRDSPLTALQIAGSV